MSKVIWKFAIQAGNFDLELPVRAEILTVGMQENGPQMWVALEPDLPKTTRHFRGVPTGGDVPYPGKYLGTVHGVEGWMVFHIYEV